MIISGIEINPFSAVLITVTIFQGHRGVGKGKLQVIFLGFTCMDKLTHTLLIVMLARMEEKQLLSDLGLKKIQH